MADALSHPVPELRSDAARFLDWVAERHPDSASAPAAAELRGRL